MKIYTTFGDGLEALRQLERPLPEPTEHQVLVRIRAASLNFRDLLVIKGIESWKPNEERIPVSDGAGEIVAVGAKVRKWKPGDRVAGIFLPEWINGELTPKKYVRPLGGAAMDGVLAEYVVFDEKSIVKVPANLTDIESASLPIAALTAWHAVRRRSQVKKGESVLIQGTGGVSLFAAQFVHALGAHPVVISSSDSKLEKMKTLGAAHVVNYRVFPEWEKQILELTGGRGVDHVIETVGGENLNRSLNAVKISGSISFIGLIAGLKASINTYQFVTKNVRIHGIETGSRQMFEEMNRFIEAHRINPVIDRVFPVAEVQEALGYLESGRHLGKIVLQF